MFWKRKHVELVIRTIVRCNEYVDSKWVTEGMIQKYGSSVLLRLCIYSNNMKELQ